MKKLIINKKIMENQVLQELIEKIKDGRMSDEELKTLLESLNLLTDTFKATLDGVKEQKLVDSIKQ